MTPDLPDDVAGLLRTAAETAEACVIEARTARRAAVAVDGALDRGRLDADQHAAHGLAWMCRACAN